MAALHLVNRPTALSACLEVAHPEDGILLIQDAIYAGVNDFDRRLFAIDEDVRARGLQDRLHPSTELASYADFVDLVVAHHPIVSWR